MTSTGLDHVIPGPQSNDPAARRYGVSAILLHWILAFALAGQVWLGWYEGDLPDNSPAQDSALNLHMAVGLTILLLTLLRLALRFTRPWPALPAGMPRWERLLAQATHVLFYVLMLGLPLSGWALASLGRRPIPFWGLFNWPHLPVVAGLVAPAQRRAVHHALLTFHGTILVWIGIALVVLHIAGALRHQFDRTPVLWRMLPFMRPPAS